MLNWQGLRSRQRLFEIASVLLGCLVPFAFAPYHFSYLVFPVIAAFLFLNYKLAPRAAFFRGWLFGVGQFVAGIYWVYFSIHVYGHAPLILTLILIVLLASYCALFPAFAFYLASRFRFGDERIQLLIMLPFMWAFTEWLRGYLFTGFPWLQTGVSQVDTPLAGFAPIFGALGVGLFVFIIAGSLVLLVANRLNKQLGLAALVCVFVLGWVLKLVDWTEPAGKSLKVSLPQLSIDQARKWRADTREPSMQWYLDQTRQNKDSNIIIWPETAIPSYLRRVDNFWNIVRQEAQQNDNDVLAGVFLRNPETGRYYNSLVGTNGDYYQKRHLVPLGEYFPLRDLLSIIDKLISIPMNDIANGPREQKLMTAAGQTLGVSICFEDVFDREIRNSLPDATLLVNVSNDAWFHKSIEPYQHHQIAQMRAIESSRYMLRSTNSGVSSIIDNKGNAVVVSKLFERTTITAEAVPMNGSTPYVMWGNAPLVLLSLGVLGWRVYLNRINPLKGVT